VLTRLLGRFNGELIEKVAEPEPEVASSQIAQETSHDEG
jgi:hypothetical protein